MFVAKKNKDENVCMWQNIGLNIKVLLPCLKHTAQVDGNVFYRRSNWSISHHRHLHFHFALWCRCTWQHAQVKTEMCEMSVRVSQRKKNGLSLPLCSLRCILSFPWLPRVACCLSPRHCLDSLRPPQEGKVDIYIEAFGMATSRRGFLSGPRQSCHKNTKHTNKTKTKLETGINQKRRKKTTTHICGIKITGWDKRFFRCFHL